MILCLRNKNDSEVWMVSIWYLDTQIAVGLFWLDFLEIQNDMTIYS